MTQKLSRRPKQASKSAPEVKVSETPCSVPSISGTNQHGRESRFRQIMNFEKLIDVNENIHPGNLSKRPENLFIDKDSEEDN
jgi:hypothetical protein